MSVEQMMKLTLASSVLSVVLSGAALYYASSAASNTKGPIGSVYAVAEVAAMNGAEAAGNASEATDSAEQARLQALSATEAASKTNQMLLMRQWNNQ